MGVRQRDKSQQMTGELRQNYYIIIENYIILFFIINGYMKENFGANFRKYLSALQYSTSPYQKQHFIYPFLFAVCSNIII